MDTVSPAHPCCSLHQTRAHIHVHYCTDTHDYVGIIHSEGIHTYMYVHYECLVLQNANCSLSESIESKHRASSYIHMYTHSYWEEHTQDLAFNIAEERDSTTLAKLFMSSSVSFPTGESCLYVLGTCMRIIHVQCQVYFKVHS